MVKSFQYRRLVSLAILLVAAFCGLGYRLVDLQVVRHDELSAKARTNTQRTMTMEPRRGEIRDVRGNLLATVLPVKTVCADPTLITNRYPEVARVLAPLLHTNESYLVERLQPRVVRHTTNSEPVYDKHVVLKHRVKVEEWELIQKTLAAATFGIDTNHFQKSEKGLLRNLREKAVFSEEGQVRVYPNKSLAAHVLGFVGTSDQTQEIAGKAGIEWALNSKLSGVRGWRQTEKDSRGREQVALRQQDVEARDGLNVMLTLDAGIQHIVETELAEAMQQHTPISISCTVIRPRTGEILAMATLPNYDPNNPGASPMDHLRNRVITDQAEPGSTFKIVVVSGALNDQLITLNDKFDCEHGHFAFAGRVLHDHESYGILSVESIITKSSNIGSAKIGIRMGEASLHQYMRNFGFGERTGVYLPGEIPGIVWPLKKWEKLSISRVPMGHEVASTPLQMVMAMAAIANDGKLMRPMIIDRLEDDAGQTVLKCQPQLVRQVVQASAARQMVQALKTVVGPDGTAPKAKLDLYTVAGKTGTAQKVVNGVYAPGKYFSSFIGFFPADNPQLCISVVMDEPKQGHYGGQTAAPVFKDIALRAANYLNITPDVETTPRLPDTLAVPGVSNPPALLKTARNN
jgi:cell division protein FtsI/penicillin-binding protein 2